MPDQPRYKLYRSVPVLEDIRGLGDPELTDSIMRTIGHVLEDPYNDPATTALATRPYVDDDCPNCYTVAVQGRALILYQIYKDYPLVRLLQLLVL